MAPRLISTTRTSGDRTGYLMFRPDYSRLFYQETFDTEKFCSHPKTTFATQPAQKQTLTNLPMVLANTPFSGFPRQAGQQVD